MHNSFWKLATLTGIVGIGCLVVMQVQRELPASHSLGDAAEAAASEMAEDSSGGYSWDSSAEGALPVPNQPQSEPAFSEADFTELPAQTEPSARTGLASLSSTEARKDASLQEAFDNFDVNEFRAEAGETDSPRNLRAETDSYFAGENPFGDQFSAEETPAPTRVEDAVRAEREATVRGLDPTPQFESNDATAFGEEPAFDTSASFNVDDSFDVDDSSAQPEFDEAAFASSFFSDDTTSDTTVDDPETNSSTDAALMLFDEQESPASTSVNEVMRSQTPAAPAPISFDGAFPIETEASSRVAEAVDTVKDHVAQAIDSAKGQIAEARSEVAGRFESLNEESNHDERVKHASSEVKSIPLSADLPLDAESSTRLVSHETEEPLLLAQAEPIDFAPQAEPIPRAEPVPQTGPPISVPPANFAPADTPPMEEPSFGELPKFDNAPLPQTQRPTPGSGNLIQTVPQSGPTPAQPVRQEGPRQVYVGDGTVDPGTRRGTLQPQLRIDKSAPGKAVLGKPLIYRITVTNIGNARARDVVVQDQIPRGCQLTGTIPRAELDEGRLVWRMGELEPGRKTEISVRVTPTAEGQIGSVATVSFAADVAAETTITAPKLKFTLAGPREVMMGEKVTYKYTIVNEGSGEANNVMIRNVIPAGLKHPGGADLEYPIGTLPPGQSKDIVLQLSAVAPGELLNQAVVTADGNVSTKAEKPLTVLGRQLVVTRRGPRLRYIGRNANFENAVKNESNRPAIDATIIERIPDGMEFVEASDGGRYQDIQRTVVWKLDRLEPNETRSLRITLKPKQSGEQVSMVQIRERSGLRSEAKSTHIGGKSRHDGTGYF